MSVKFEKDTIRTSGIPAGQAYPQGYPQGYPQAPPPQGYSQGPPPQSYAQPPPQAYPQASPQAYAQGPPNPILKGGPVHQLADEVGIALTGGKADIGQRGYLAAYLKQLQTNPLRTKMLTSGGLAALQELLGSWIAKDRNKDGGYFTSRVPKMAVYGAFISAPLGHVLISILQKLFSGRTSLKAKVLQIIASNLIIAPIQNSVYLLSMAIIAGAKTIHQVHATWKAGFWPVMKVSWVVSPLALAFAQQFLPEQTWVPFFNVISFVIGTYVNSITKKKRLAALRKRYDESRGGRDDYPGGSKRDY